MKQNIIALAALALLTTVALQAADTAAAKAESKEKKPEEPHKIHSDPRFKGKVTVYGTSSESFGEAPKDNELKTTTLDDPEAALAPKPLPEPAPVAPAKKR